MGDEKQPATEPSYDEKEPVPVTVTVTVTQPSHDEEEPANRLSEAKRRIQTLWEQRFKQSRDWCEDLSNRLSEAKRRIQTLWEQRFKQLRDGCEELWSSRADEIPFEKKSLPLRDLIRLILMHILKDFLLGIFGEILEEILNIFEDLLDK